MYGTIPEKKTRRLVSSCLALLILGLVSIHPAPVGAHDEPRDSLTDITLQIQQEPHNPDLYLKRGELHRISGHWDLALADFDRVAQLDPDHATVQFHRGRLLFDAGQAQPAREALDAFLGAHPDHLEGLIVRGRVLRALGHPVEAAQDYTRALSLAPNPTPVLFLERAEALADAGGEYVGIAVQGLDEGIQTLGPLILLESLAIDLDIRRHQYDAALARIDQVLTAVSRKEKWLARRGEVLEGAGRLAEARAAYEQALTAIEALPSRLRQVPASQELEAHVRALLARENF